MSEWDFQTPSPEDAGIILAAVSGALVGSFFRRAKSRLLWAGDFFVGVMFSLTLGPSVVVGLGGTWADFISPAAVHSLLALSGRDIVHRLRKFIANAKISGVPMIEEKE